MSISEQVKELRKVAENFREWEYNRFYDVISEAADTIEYLSAKLQAANMERTDKYYGNTRIYCVKKKNKKDAIVSIMYDRADGKYHFVNLSRNHICSCAFNTVDEAIADMESQKENGIIKEWKPLQDPYHEP